MKSKLFKFKVVFTNSKGNKAFVILAYSPQHAIKKALRETQLNDYFCIYAEQIVEQSNNNQEIKPKKIADAFN